MPQRENEDGTITYYAVGHEPDGQEGMVTVSDEKHVESKVVDAPEPEMVTTGTAEVKEPESALAPEVK